MTRRFAILCALALLLAGCGSTIDGSAQPGTATGGEKTSGFPSTRTSGAPSTSGAPTTETGPEITTPDTSTGEPTDPGPDPAELPEVDEEIGRWLEARRLGDRLPNPNRVDDRYIMVGNPTTAFVDSTALEDLLLEGSTDIIDDIGGFVAGYVASRSDRAYDDFFTLAVLEFETTDQAAEAAETMLQPDRATMLLPVPDFGDLKGLVWDDPDGLQAVEAAIASDRLVFYAWVNGVEEWDHLPTISAGLKAMEDTFEDMVLTPPDELTSLPLDNGDLLAHTVDVDFFGARGWHEPNGALHLQTDAERSEELFDRADVDLVSYNTVSIYRTADESGAVMVQEEFMAEAADYEDYAEQEVDGMPDGVRCSVGPGEAHYCVGTVGRYAYEVIENGQDISIEVATEQAALLSRL